MEFDKLTLKELQEKRPDLVTGIENAIKEQANEDGKIKKLESDLAEEKKKNADLAKKVDDFEVKEKARETETRILELIEEAKIKKEYVTEPFMESLRSAKDEEARKALIEDRKKIVDVKKSGVRNMGDEQEIEESEHDETKDKDTWRGDLSEGIKE